MAKSGKTGSKATMGQAAQMRKLAEAADKRKAEAEDLRQQRQRRRNEEIDAEVRTKIREIYTRAWKPRIRAAAKTGSRKAVLVVTISGETDFNGPEFDNYSTALLKYGVPFLQQEGFMVTGNRGPFYLNVEW